MKVLIFLVFVGLALGAMVPATKPKVPNVAFHGAVNALIARAQPPAWQVQSSDWLAELIEAILGIKVVQLLNLINDTLVGSDKLVEKAVTQLQKIILEAAAEIRQELEAIINDALEEALKIMQPILNQMAKILPAIPSYGPNSIVKNVGTQDLVSDIILAILGITLEEFLTSINDALILLAEVLNETFVKLNAVAANVGGELAVKINEVIQSSLAEAQALVKPLVEMLSQIFPLKKNIISELIGVILSLDFVAIFTEASKAGPVIEQIQEKALVDIDRALRDAKPEVKWEINVIIRNGLRAGARILQPLLKMMFEMFPELKPELIKEGLAGGSFDQLFALALATLQKMDNLFMDTIAKVIEVAEGSGAETSAQIKAIIGKAVSDVDITLKPILVLMKPLFEFLNAQQPIRALSFPTIAKIGQF